MTAATASTVSAAGTPLVGGRGDDTYVVDNAGDVVTESIANAKGGGIDTVESSVGFTLATRVNVDNLILTGSGNIAGTGNALANYLEGNVGNNRLDGAAGNDIVVGGVGNDTVLGGLGNDILFGGKGADTLTGGAGRDLFYYGALRTPGTSSRTSSWARPAMSCISAICWRISPAQPMPSTKAS